MSKQQLEAFYKRVQNDSDLYDKLKALRGNEGHVYDEMTKLGRENGFDFTADEIIEFRSENDHAEIDALQKVDSLGDCCAEVCGTFLGHYVGR